MLIDDIKTVVIPKNNFKDDLELSLKTQVFCDGIYKEMGAVKIDRYTKDNNFILDQKYHIDCMVESRLGMCYTMQEKILRNKFASYNTYTVEYMQNRHTNEKGELFHICSQLYLSGYLNKEETAIEKYIVIDIARFKMWLGKSGKLNNIDLYTRPTSGSNASFFYIDYRAIPKYCIVRTFGNKDYFDYPIINDDDLFIQK